MMKKITSVVFLLLLLLPGVVAAAAIVYIPIDNRPVCLEDPLNTMKAAGIKAIVPPQELLAGRDRAGDPDQLWSWLFTQAGAADALVLSADTLLYGGLVPSRLHHLPADVLNKRVDNFRRLRDENPTLRIYVFSTVMRTPKMSAGGTDPAYFEADSSHIFHYSALRDKGEQEQLSDKEIKDMAYSFAAVPESDMVDWLTRRQLNYTMNSKLLALTKEGIFSFFCLGRDDNDRYSRTRQELRGLLRAVPDLSGATFATFPGADQLGLVLLTRAVNDSSGSRPFVAVVYAPGTGPQTIPTYQGEPVSTSILSHVFAAGGYLIRSTENADLVLAVNTPTDGITREAESTANSRHKNAAPDDFVASIAKQLQSKPVAVADIAFGNGSDNALMDALVSQGIPGRLAAYSGWNTASNTVGFAISQGLLARQMCKEDRQQLIGVRMLDDWAYQANVRQAVRKELVYPQGWSEVRLGTGRSQVEALTTEKLKQFADDHFGSFTVAPFTARQPWDRMFETQIVFPVR